MTKKALNQNGKYVQDLIDAVEPDFIFNNIGVWLLASVSGALLGAIWNFIFSSIFTWKTR